MSSLKKHSLFGSVLAAIGLGSPATRGSDASKYIKSESGAWARAGSTKYINHKKVLQDRKECAAHNSILRELRSSGIVTSKGNVVEGRLADYNAAIAAQVKKFNLA